MAEHEILGSETVIRENLVVKGGMVGKGNVTIAGTMEGNIDTKDAVNVQPKGKVTGDIAAREVTVSGLVEGNIVASSRLTIKETGRVNGDVRTPSIHIAEGAVIIGRLTVDRPGGKETSA